MITNETLHKKTPQQITALLYEACLNNLEDAKAAILVKDQVKANAHLQKCNDILRRLGAGINYEAGIIADQLDAVYNYMADKIIEANYKKDIPLIDEVITQMEAIKSAWQQAMVDNIDRQPKSFRQKTNAYEQTAVYED
ncbi:flagellar protein FliS [Evansella vedderi]|uniref:Flagellar secretion chaperone FliS n=1 Tax=Evansella vedderi TaxID=38282 RepID=A0ABT9ZZC9_9BACI|nr:flagellar export chaperone FliS [Evansella vedderi]MDQ0256209.1 flagellar protein FliS [Evansella vedderi]